MTSAICTAAPSRPLRTAALAAWTALVLGAAPRAGADVVTAPYLQAVGQNEVTVLVECNATTSATVNFGLTTSYGSSATTSSTVATSGSSPATWVHRVRVTGLAANTIYHYSVHHEGSTTADASFRTAVAAGTPFRFAFLADFRDGTSIHDAIAARVLGTDKPAMSVYGGDLCATSSYANYIGQFLRANELALAATVPFFNAVGNHEGWSTNTQAFTQAPAGGTNGYYSFDYGDVHVLVLNNLVAYDPASAQYAFAQSDLAATPKPWKIVAAHYPAYCSGGHGEDTNMKAMTTNLFEPNNVALVLVGHSHFYQHNLVNNIHHFVLGTVGAPQATPTSASYTVKTLQDYCYGVLDVTSTTLDVNVYNDHGTLLDTLHLDCSFPAPSGLAATAVSPSRIDLAWTDNASTETRYRIERATSGGAFAFLANVGANVTSYSDTTGLAANATYRYRVRAETDTTSSAYSNEASATTLDDGGGGTVDVRVAAGSDDAEETASSGAVNLTSTDLELTVDGSAQVIGMRFFGVNVPRGATVTQAYIQFKVDEAVNTDPVALTVAGQAADNAAAFTTATYNVSSRTRTTATVAWSPPTWGTVGEAGSNQRTPELKTVVQEVVNRAGWSRGNALAAVITGSGKRVAEAYDKGAGGGPLLHVVYAGALPAAPSTLAATAASSSQIHLSWTDNASNETGFKIERKTGSGGVYAQIATVGANVTAYPDTGLSSSTTYYYRVRTTNVTGDSAYSNEASATTQAVVQPGTLQLSSATYSKSEGNSGTSTVTLTVTRTGGSGGAVGVSYATSNGTATAGSDYTAASGTLSWTDGDSAGKTFTVTVTGDTAVEPDETATITLSSPTGGAMLGSPSTATLTIVNDDALPAAPTLLAATAVHESRVDLAWKDNASTETGFEIERAVGGGAFAALATVGAGVTTYANEFLDDATLYTYRVRAVNASGASAWSNSSGATTLDAGPLPNPWETADIGSCGVPGNASWRTDVFTGWGSGADIWNAADAFRFVYRPLTGDGEIRARVLGVENTNAWAKAGVMVRETLEAGSRHAMMVLTPGNGLSFQRRTTTGGTSLSTSGGAATAPRWVRVTRAGSTLTGAASTDGTTWTTVGTETIAMGDAVYVGLAVTSHDNAQRCTARFDNVELLQTPVEVDVSLAAGYTLVGLPLEPETSLDSEGLVQAMNAQGGSCTSVIRYVDGQYETHPAGSSEAVFPIRPGEGYFVRCTAAGTWRMRGYRFTAMRAGLPLSAGYTLVALPLETTPDRYTSETAVQEINKDGGSATQVLKYENGRFITHPAGSSEGVFPLAPGAGYFIRCAAPSIWNLTK